MVSRFEIITACFLSNVQTSIPHIVSLKEKFETLANEWQHKYISGSINFERYHSGITVFDYSKNNSRRVMERGFGYFEAVNANQEQLSKISDEKLIMLALCEILSPIEKISNAPFVTAIVNELETRANK